MATFEFSFNIPVMYFRQSIWAVLFVTLSGGLLSAQAPKKYTSADIYQGIEKLNVLATALYVAAHPDDENTRLISHLSNGVQANTTYLSMTRGDGGQNLIGAEMREELGLIRTQELLAARRIDGGQQLFTRANDFGYSKTPEETMTIWNKQEVLADVVFAIRKLQPDIIINRFPHTHFTGNHGHHTSSAILSYEAFDLAGDPNAFPEQLKYVKPWQPESMYFNTSWWFYGSRQKFAEADRSKMLSVDVGEYYPAKGMSNSEISALSRSMHKSQGFGASGTRGSQLEYLELVKGNMPSNKEDLFSDIQTTWSRVAGGAQIELMVDRILEDFDFQNPSASVPALLEVRKAISGLSETIWKGRKIDETEALVRQCLGLFAELVAEDFRAAPGDSVVAELEVVNRSPFPVVLRNYWLSTAEDIQSVEAQLAYNAQYRTDAKFAIPAEAHWSSPYWLTEPASMGMFTVGDQQMRGIPDSERPVNARLEFDVAGYSLEIVVPAVYKRTDRVRGEVYRPFEVTAPVFVNIQKPVYIFGEPAPKDVRVTVKAGRAQVTGQLHLNLPEGWKCEPSQVDFSLREKGQEQIFSFELRAPGYQDEGQIEAIAKIGDRSYEHALVEIEYDHIPSQTIMRKSRSKVVRIDLQKEGLQIGYVKGAGDDIPSSLEEVGYYVTTLEPDEITPENLGNYDAVIMGIRAYNTLDRLKHKQQTLFEYVNNGGNLIVQYNTSRGLVTSELGPYPMKLSRDRVTDEYAEVRILAPDHPAMQKPNKISEKDFDGWVQERGLYFPNEWDEAYTPIFSSNDKGEEPKDGSLLIARHGKGYYVYTGISWFRQLPAGVPGAYRIFTNLISLGKEKRS